LDHAVDLATLHAEAAGKEVDEMTASFLIDVKDAFMSIPLSRAEMRFNCARLSERMALERPPSDEAEDVAGDFVVWRVLGFGGRPNPLVFARVAAFAARTGQAMFRTHGSDDKGCEHSAPLRLQMYVDDPIAAVHGTRKRVLLALDLLLLWWLVLGVPLSWKKGVLSWESHAWIGVVYKPLPSGDVCMTLPPSFLEELLGILVPFCAARGTRSLREAVRMVGKAGRVAHIVPLANPFVHGLWGALSAAQLADKTSQEAPKGFCCTRRFAQPASWMRALIQGGSSALVPLERTVSYCPPGKAAATEQVVEFDASPWGGGGALRDRAGYIEHFAIQWEQSMFGTLDVTVGEARSQTFFESCTLLLCLVVWGGRFPGRCLQLAGDNTAALQNAIALKGRGAMLALARELAWRRARFQWQFSVGHLPSESNSVADALSRLSAPSSASMPRCLKDSREMAPPDVRAIWVAMADAHPSL